MLDTATLDTLTSDAIGAGAAISTAALAWSVHTAPMRATIADLHASPGRRRHTGDAVRHTGVLTVAPGRALSHGRLV